MSGQTYVTGSVTAQQPSGLTDDPLAAATITAINDALDQLVEIRLSSTGAWSYKLAGGVARAVLADAVVIIPVIDVHDPAQNDQAITITNAAAAIDIFALGSKNTHGSI